MNGDRWSTKEVLAILVVIGGLGTSQGYVIHSLNTLKEMEVPPAWFKEDVYNHIITHDKYIRECEEARIQCKSDINSIKERLNKLEN